MSEQVIIDVVAQHAEEAAFLWLVRDSALRSAQYDLGDLIGLDTRIAAHLEGLEIAGDTGWEIAARELGWQQPGEVFAAGFLAFSHGDPERMDGVVSVAEADAELARGAIAALTWLDSEVAAPWIDQLVGADSAERRRIGVRAAAAHRLRTNAFERALDAQEGAVLAAALRATGELGDPRLVHRCRAHLTSGELGVRFWAAWSLALSGDDAGISILRGVAEGAGPLAGHALDAAARVMSPTQAHAWHRLLSESPETLRQAIGLAAELGEPIFVPWLLEQMCVPELARLAGEAFLRVTGVDLAVEGLEGDWPEDFEAGPTEDPQDEGVSVDPDEDLAWPAPGRFESWWAENRGRFEPETRYLDGWPVSAASLSKVLREGSQRKRTAAALDLKRLASDQPLFEVRAPAARQKKLLGAR